MSTAELAQETAREAIAAQEAATAQANHAAALDKVAAATISGVSSRLDYESSVNRLKDGINDLDDRTQEYTKAVEENGAGSKEAETANRALRDAHDGIKTSALAAAAAAVKVATDTAAASGEVLAGQQKADLFRNELISLASQAEGPTREAILGLSDEIAGLPNRTVYVDADTSAAQAKIASLQRQLNSIQAGAASTSGAQQFAMGMDMGPVRGRPGQAVPIIAHAGEWVLTPEQLAELSRRPYAAPNAPSPAPAAAAPGIDYGRLASAMSGMAVVMDGQKVGTLVSRAQAEMRKAHR
jgi:hypothetical protein